MRVVLFGVYALGLTGLRALAEHEVAVVGVVTKPDPVALPLFEAEARRLGVPLLASNSGRSEALREFLTSCAPDVVAVCGFHRILSDEVLRIPRLATINLHASLLPSYRGPCPWKWAIVNGERETGVTAHLMTAEADAGELLAQARVDIAADDDGESLFQKLARCGGPFLARTIREFERGCLQPVPQDPSEASYFGFPTDEQARITWAERAERITCRVRGFHPRPGAWTSIDGVRVRVLECELLEPAHGAPGTVLEVAWGSVIVASSDAPVRLVTLATGAARESAECVFRRLGGKEGMTLGV